MRRSAIPKAAVVEHLPDVRPRSGSRGQLGLPLRDRRKVEREQDAQHRAQADQSCLFPVAHRVSFTCRSRPPDRWPCLDGDFKVYAAVQSCPRRFRRGDRVAFAHRPRRAGLVVPVKAHVAIPVTEDQALAEAAQPVGMDHLTDGGRLDVLSRAAADEPTVPRGSARLLVGCRIGAQVPREPAAAAFQGVRQKPQSVAGVPLRRSAPGASGSAGGRASGAGTAPTIRSSRTINGERRASSGSGCRFPATARGHAERHLYAGASLPPERGIVRLRHRLVRLRRLLALGLGGRRPDPVVANTKVGNHFWSCLPDGAHTAGARRPRIACGRDSLRRIVPSSRVPGGERTGDRRRILTAVASNVAAVIASASAERDRRPRHRSPAAPGDPRVQQALRQM